MEFIKEAGVSPQKSMDIKNDKITIKPLRDKDVDIFSKWLAKEYIYKWFCPDGEEHKMAWLDEVNNRNTQYHYMKHFIVYYNDKAIGFCLYLDCYFEKEYIPKHYGKFRQINRYLEIVSDSLPYLAESPSFSRPLKIIDFGCGKAYLTFAIYHYLHEIKGLNVKIIGLDLKKDVIEFCSRVAEDLHYDDLKFMIGDIADYTNDSADMVVTLHACDTATDYALITAVRWNTKVILSVPCCQHELFSQIDNDLHQPMLKHGILKDRLTEYLTDGNRGLKLESFGYDVPMIEFTSLEHTSRNIMIKAVKKSGRNKDDARSKKARRQYEQLRDFYNVKPSIDIL